MNGTKMTGGEALVAALVAHGVDAVFGIPGTHNLEIYRHLAERGVRHVGTRHEQGAGYAADGYARSTGRPGVAVVTTGPALLNAATALAQAWSDSVPILVVSPGMPLRHPALGNGLLHESRDQQASIAAVTAASLRATSVAEVPTAVAQAFAIMTSGRPRPVHLEVPLDVLAEVDLASVVAPLVLPVAIPDARVIEEAAARLATARRVLVIAGGGARWAGAEVAHLAELLGAPVVTTTNGKGTIPEDHPLALGAGVQVPVVRELVEEADAVLAIGTELGPADFWYGPVPLDGKLIRVDIDPVGIVTNVQPAVAVIGDAAASLTALAKALQQHEVGERADARATVAGLRERKRAESRQEGATWVELLDALAPALPRDVLVGADNAMVCYFGAMANLPTYTPASFLFPTGFGTLGYGLPAAIGAKVADPERPVIAMLGDGGIMFTVQELATAAELGLTLPVIVVDNHGYGEIRNEMIERGDPVHAVTFGGTDFAALGRSVGCLGETVTGTDGLAAAVTRAFEADRPTVIHVVVPATTPDQTAAAQGGTA